MRIVFDTNVLFAATVSPGLCRELVATSFGVHELITSAEMLEELRDRLTGKIGMSASEAEFIVGGVALRSRLVEPVVIPASVCRDPDDCVVLGTAVAGEADAIVTGDQDLLCLGTFRGIMIITPRTLVGRTTLPGNGGAGRVAERRPAWRRVKPAEPRRRGKRRSQAGFFR
ncbi:MAG: putative toxin-antitoxin system toxin component, PIN family [Candidatus Coatesbacteria bacterium]